MPRGVLRHATGAKSHAGLWLSCFSEILPQKNPDRPEARLAAFRTARSCAGATTQGAGGGVYGQAFARWRAMHVELGSVFQPVKTQGRLIVGLGIETPQETGLRLQHTYGVPVIPGSAVKGVCAFYAHSVWGLENTEFRMGGSGYQFLFGSQEEAGMVTFEDAWMDPAAVGGALNIDVMTPHQGDYYQEKMDTHRDRIPPSDQAAPVPIPFLSVSGKFWLAMRCEGEDREAAGRWQMVVKDLALAALRDEGIGGKTRAGYGRLIAAT